ncbi:unnamed protein product [Linum trigynum]
MCCMVSCFNATLCSGSDEKGRCSAYPLPAGNFQLEDIFDGFRSKQFDGGKRAGCYTRDYVDEDHNPYTVYASFTCDVTPGIRCRLCFNSGITRMEQGCRGRAGGSVLFENYCCFRYETAYNICT